MPVSELKILLVDDHPVVREGYRRLLERQDGYRVVAEADSAQDAYGAYQRHAPDVVIMDISLSGPSGIEAVRHIRQWDQQAKILMFTMHKGPQLGNETRRAGAQGYVLKSQAADDLVQAIDTLLAGGTFFGAPPAPEDWHRSGNREECS